MVQGDDDWRGEQPRSRATAQEFPAAGTEFSEGSATEGTAAAAAAAEAVATEAMAKAEAAAAALETVGQRKQP